MRILNSLFLMIGIPFFLYGGIKEEISSYQNELQKIELPSEKSLLYFQLAKAYLTDQEVEKAFHYLLLALNDCPSKDKLPLLNDEKDAYLEALAMYLKRGGQDPQEAAETLLKNYGSLALSHTEFAHLNFLLCTSYANLGNYERFFDNVYTLYPHFKEDFLSYKICGILALRLSQIGKLPEERLQFRKKAYQMLELALDKNPEDASLYKILTFLAKEEGCPDNIPQYLSKMIEIKIAIPRSEIYLFVREAASLGEIELAEKIIKRSKELYQYSKAIEQAEKYLQNITSSKE